MTKWGKVIEVCDINIIRISLENKCMTQLGKICDDLNLVAKGENLT